MNVTVASDGTGDYNCDTSRTDNDIQINQAIQYIVNSGGGDIFIKNGVYTISSPIYLYSNINIYGNGMDNTTIKLKDWANWGGIANCSYTNQMEINPNEYGLFRTPNMATLNQGIPTSTYINNVKIHHLYIDGNKIYQCERYDSGYYKQIETGRVSNWEIHDIKFGSAVYDQLVISEGNMISIYNNIHTEGNHANISIVGGTNVYISNNNIICGSNAGVRFSGGVNNSRIQNNIIHGGKGSNWGIELNTYGNGVQNNNIIEGNTIYAQGYSGIILFNSHDTTPCYSTGSLDNTVIKNNIIYHNAFTNASTDNRNAGIWISDADNTSIINNTIYGNGGSGIVFRNYMCTDSSVDGPYTATVKNNILSNNFQYGLDVKDTKFIISESYNAYYGNLLGDVNNITLGNGSITIQDPLLTDARTRCYGPWDVGCTDPVFGPYRGNSWMEVLLDFHLKSIYGRWTPSGFVYTDTETSPLIEAGDPTSDNSLSPWGGKIEIGAYGNTLQASNTSGCPIPICNISITQT